MNSREEDWEFLSDLLPQVWYEQARTTGALRRGSGVGSADCPLRLILRHTATGLSLRQTVVRAREQSFADISDVALLKWGSPQQAVHLPAGRPARRHSRRSALAGVLRKSCRSHVAGCGALPMQRARK